jgi:formylglycine-generating enzyme required for sulfatase activity
VVNVSWDDAARYCNWLSAREGLPPAYEERGGAMRLVRPVSRGYRMPTEAEWAYVARAYLRSEPARYPWAGGYPPTAVSGNYADARIADTLAEVVPGGYDDGHRGPAPVGSYPASPAGFFDLSGNVAEWVNDYYTVYPAAAQTLVRDPLGPESGQHRVVRGSSWRHANITELRLSYRDYSKRPRPDLGFRIARYADE